MHELTGFQRDLLYLVAGLEKPHGLGIKRELEQYYGESITQGRLYPNLDALVEDGYIKKGEKDRRTNFYELTANGRQAILERRAWENDTFGQLFE
ncbi:PadR family transcriptional regulator [Halogeometricum borinquense]|uniref:PadR family transcriptional regulator n=1 Tax=Halogeometricum borinquense TaxID=60847 RepID=A0A6C0UGV1_9EURY|nr:helix-turn-helix transcriptional regulator [Halogeometricum borinquense]QIB74437.1 PadR family transcriptional regulator [Halogeometricum borinquense]